jgi:hypothetical protein
MSLTILRSGFDKEARTKALAADAMSLWRSNQSTPVISCLARSTKANEARSASPYTPSMAQSSVHGACGFVLARDSESNALYGHLSDKPTCGHYWITSGESVIREELAGSVEWLADGFVAPLHDNDRLAPV